MKKRPEPYRLSFLLFLLTLLLVSGCCTGTVRELGKAKEHATSGDFAWIAAQDIKCEETCEGCNQLHLLKGDACYRLAKKGTEPLRYYPCAAQHLETGISMTKQWQTESVGQTRPQTYVNLCDSLRNWRDLSPGAEADKINERLLKDAQGFLAAEPGDPCGIAYLNNARYAKLQPCLLHPERCPALCGDLNAVLRSIDEGASRAAGTACEANMQEIKKEASKAREIVRCP
jgi:hypothetical protein